MPVLGVFVLAIYAAYRCGVFSAVAVGAAVFAWICVAILTGVPLLALACVVAAANLGWISGLWARAASRPGYAG